MQELKLKESIIQEAQIKIITANQKLFDSFFRGHENDRSIKRSNKCLRAAKIGNLEESSAQRW